MTDRYQSEAHECVPLDVLRRVAQAAGSDAEEAAVGRHLPDCEPCRRQFDQLMAADSSFGALGNLPLDQSEADLGAFRAMDAPRFPHSVVHHNHVELSGGLQLSLPRQREYMASLGKYDVISILGEGGMGLVLKARDHVLDREVALKVITPRWAHDETSRSRFIKEAQSAAQLVHPNILTIHDVCPDGDVPFIVMEYIRGNSLAMEIAERGRFEPLHAIRIVKEMLKALGHAHAKGFVHRDIKPANVLLESQSGLVKLVDFGLARGMAETVRHTMPGTTVGTPWYMSPEQITDRDPDPRSDLFSVAVVLFEMLVGDLPFPGKAAFEVMERIRNEPAPDPCELAPGIPRGLADVVLRGLEKDPAERYFSATQFAEAIDSLSNAPSVTGAGASGRSPAGLPVSEQASMDNMQTIMPEVVEPGPPPVTPAADPPDELRVMLPDGLTLQMIRIKAAEFKLPEDDGWNKRQASRSGKFNHDFYLGKFPVTQGQFRSLMGGNPSQFSDDPNNPVDNVSLTSAVLFCQTLTGHLVRSPESLDDQSVTAVNADLPREAQWEYACRAGAETLYSFGDDHKRLAEHGWYEKNSNRKTHPVGQLKPNDWGFFDMHGNVWEWTGDAPDFDTGGQAVLRGGSWSYNARYCQCARRHVAGVHEATANYGFRVVIRIAPGSSVTYD